jgi:RimJ/RimL family protein N-acetyltransferase
MDGSQMGHGEIEIVTDRLHLRAVRTEDLDAVATLGADNRVMGAFGGAVPREKSRDWLERQLVHWRDFRFGRFFVERDGVFVGLVGLYRTEFDAARTARSR